MPSFTWWIIGSETMKALVALAIALGLIALPAVVWGLMWKGYALTQRSEHDDIYLILENQRLDRLLDQQQKQKEREVE